MHTRATTASPPRARLLALIATIVVGISILVAPARADASTTISPGSASVRDLPGQADDATATFTVPPRPEAPAYVGVRVRVTGDTFYLLQSRLSSTNEVSISVKKVRDGVTTDLVPSKPTKIRAGAAGLTLSLSASGGSAVTLDGVITSGGAVERVAFTDTSNTAITSGSVAQSWRYMSAAATQSVPIEVSDSTYAPTNVARLGAGASKVWAARSSGDADSAAFVFDPASTGSRYVGIRTRVSSGGFYLLQAAVSPQGTVIASIKRAVSGSVTTNLVAPFDTGLTLTAGESLVLHADVSGTGSSIAVRGSIGVAGESSVVTFRGDDTSATRLRATAGTAAWAHAGSGVAGQWGVATVPLAASVAPVPSEGGAVPTPTPPVPSPTPSAPSPTPSAPSAAPEPPVSAGRGGPDEMPDASNTGVPAGTALTVHEGDLVITTPNTVITGLEIRGFVVVKAPGAVIKNSRIVGREAGVPAAYVTNYGFDAPFTIEDSEIFAGSKSPNAMAGIMGSNFTASRVNIHDMVDGVRITGDDVTVRSSWLHSNLHYDRDPNFNGTPSHDDSIQIQRGRNILLTNNRAEDAYSSALMVTQDLGTISNVTLSKNYLEGGSCTVNVSDTSTGISRVVATDNVFGPTRRIKNCALFAPPPTVLGNTGNVWEHSDAAVKVVQGF